MAGAGSLANLVVRLVGDGTNFTRMLDKAEADTRSSAATIKKSGTTATASASAALDRYGDDAKTAAGATKKFAGDVNLTQTALAGQQVRTNSAGKSVDQYGRFVKTATMNLKKLGGTLRTVGTRMSLGITLPLLAAAAASVKLASDAEETESKLKTTFAGVGAAAQAAAKDLADNFNFANTESKALLAGTGDLLTGFGFTAAGALEMSHEINKLAADLASFQNLEGGAARASEALTKGLMGEKESLKMLGIAFDDTELKNQVALNTANGLIHATERQAKAYATLQIAQRASKNAIGDIARTGGSFANQMRGLGNDLKDVAGTIGKDLMPIAKVLLEWVRSAIGAFSGLSGTQRKVVIVVAAFVAALGPAVFLLGAVTMGMGAYAAMAATAGLSTSAFTAQLWLQIKAMVMAAAGAVVLALKMALIGGAVVLVAVGAYKLGQALNRAFGNTGIEDYNRELERSNRLQGKITAGQDAKHAAILAEANATDNLVARKKLLRRELEMAQKNEDGIIASLKGQQAVVADLEGKQQKRVAKAALATGGLGAAFVHFGGSKVLEGEQVALTELTTHLETAKARTEELRKALDATGATVKGAADKVALLALEADNLNVKFETEIDMFGKTGREAELYALTLKGVTGDQLKAATATAATLTAMEKNKAARDAAKSVTDGLEKQRATFGLAAAEITQYEMKLAGATAAERQHAAAVTADIAAMTQTQTIDAFNEKIEAQMAVMGMTGTEAEIYAMKLDGATAAQAESMRTNAKRLAGMQAEQELLAKGASLVEQYMKPQEKLTKTTAELNTLLAQGAIDQHTFDSALEAATKAMAGVEKQAAKDYKVDLKVAGVEGVEAGTAEAAARMREFLALRDEGANAPDTPEGQLAGQVAGLQDEIQHTIDMTWPEQAMQLLGDSLDAFGLGGVGGALASASSPNAGDIVDQNPANRIANNAASETGIATKAARAAKSAWIQDKLDESNRSVEAIGLPAHIAKAMAAQDATDAAPVVATVGTQTPAATQTTDEHEGRVEALLGRIASATEAVTEFTAAGL